VVNIYLPVENERTLGVPYPLAIIWEPKHLCKVRGIRQLKMGEMKGVMNSPSSNPDEKKREYYGTDRTYLDVTKKGTTYPKWNSNSLKQDTWIRGKCYRNLRYHKNIPPIHVPISIHVNLIAKRTCLQCGRKITTQKSNFIL
jgi:hypothetical protein